MNIVGLSTLEKNSLLLSAVEGQIHTNSRLYLVFSSALKEDPSMLSLVESMQNKCHCICQTSPEYRTFREHYSRLHRAIQDPLSLATRLFTQGIIPSAVKENMSVRMFSRLEKNGALLSAVEMQVRTKLNVYHDFLLTIQDEPSMQSLVESMQSTVFHTIRLDF